MSLHSFASTALSYPPFLGPLLLCIIVSYLPVCFLWEPGTSLRATTLVYRLFIFEKNKDSLECNECLKSFENK